jgi:UDP-N-acetylglucosamine 1-carboxyvinyltransferase
LRTLGATVITTDTTVTIHAAALTATAIPDAQAAQIRSSVFLLGALLGRARAATMPRPGGCNIGVRPIDQHLKGLRALGVVVEEGAHAVHCDGRRLHGGEVTLDVPSVGATENLMMAAALARGTTTIYGAAREPEVADLAAFINALGGCIGGAGTATITVCGVRTLPRGVVYRPVPDRIEAGTYLLAALSAGGRVTVRGARPDHNAALLATLKNCGAHIHAAEDAVTVRAPHMPLGGGSIVTAGYPGFATDLHAPAVAALCRARGVTVLEERLFESRFAYVGELLRMGARVRICGNLAIAEGMPALSAAALTAADLRGGAALVIAALGADGTSEVSGVGHILRGYHRLPEKLASLGARIEGGENNNA